MQPSSSRLIALVSSLASSSIAFARCLIRTLRILQKSRFKLILCVKIIDGHLRRDRLFWYRERPGNLQNWIKHCVYALHSTLRLCKQLPFFLAFRLHRSNADSSHLIFFIAKAARRKLTRKIKNLCVLLKCTEAHKIKHDARELSLSGNRSWDLHQCSKILKLSCLRVVLTGYSPPRVCFGKERTHIKNCSFSHFTALNTSGSSLASTVDISSSPDTHSRKYKDTRTVQSLKSLPTSVSKNKSMPFRLYCFSRVNFHPEAISAARAYLLEHSKTIRCANYARAIWVWAGVRQTAVPSFCSATSSQCAGARRKWSLWLMGLDQNAAYVAPKSETQ